MAMRFVTMIGVGAALILGGASCRWGELSKQERVEKTDAHPDTARGAALLFGLNGSDVDQDEAMRLLARAANGGDALALFYQGMAVTQGCGLGAPDPLRGRRLVNRAYPILREYAKNGNMESLYAVGSLCASGMIDDVSWSDAEQIYRYCMEQGYAPAFRAMGIHALETQDHAQAILWLRQAAQTDDATAKYFLSVALERSGNRTESRELLTEAARRGVPDAMYEVAKRSVDAQDAARWRERAAQSGVAPAQYEMAQPLLEQEPGKARRWLELAAGHNYFPALTELAKGRGMRHFDIDRMLLLLLAQKYGADVATELRQADQSTGLYLPVWYSTLPLIGSGAHYGLLNREIQVIADDYIGGDTVGALNSFRELVKQRQAVLPASLIWYTLSLRGLPLEWLEEFPAASDSLGLAIAAGLRGDGRQQIRYAEALKTENARDAARSAAAQIFAAVLSANALVLAGDLPAAQAMLNSVACPLPEREQWLSFIRHFCPALAETSDWIPEWANSRAAGVEGEK